MPTSTCTSGRHLLCPFPTRCGCYCHRSMTPEYARSLILKLAGARLWPDELTEQLTLARDAHRADPFHPELEAARRVLGLT